MAENTAPQTQEQPSTGLPDEAAVTQLLKTYEEPQLPAPVTFVADRGGRPLDPNAKTGFEPIQPPTEEVKPPAKETQPPAKEKPSEEPESDPEFQKKFRSELAREREIQNRRNQARKREEELRAKEAWIKGNEKKWTELIEDINTNGLKAVAFKLGITQDQLTAMALDDSNPGKPQQDPMAEIRKLREELAAEKEAAKREREDARREALQSTEEQVLADISAHVKADPDKYDLLNQFPEYQDLVYDAIQLAFEETGEDLLDKPDGLAQATERVERYIESRLSKSKKFQAAKPPGPAVPKPAPRTAASAPRPASAPKKEPETLEEADREAMRILIESGWTRF